MMSVRNDRSEARLLHARRAIAGILAAFTLAVAPAALAAPQNMDASGKVSPIVDVLVLRPMGILATLTGAAILVIAAPIIAITRPTDFAQPVEWLILRPARYTWGDPLGDHASPGY